MTVISLIFHNSLENWNILDSFTQILLCRCLLQWGSPWSWAGESARGTATTVQAKSRLTLSVWKPRLDSVPAPAAACIWCPLSSPCWRDVPLYEWVLCTLLEFVCWTWVSWYWLLRDLTKGPALWCSRLGCHLRHHFLYGHHFQSCSGHGSCMPTRTGTVSVWMQKVCLLYTSVASVTGILRCPHFFHLVLDIFLRLNRKGVFLGSSEII